MHINALFLLMYVSRMVGHGLGAVLLAYRYCSLKVVAVDRTRRACFDSFVTAFRKFGEPGKGEVCSVW